jgi:hypothetical protein
MDTKNAKNHVTLVAGLHIGYGILKIIVALIVFMAMHFAWSFIPDQEETARLVLSTILSILPMIVVFFGLLDIIAGISLLSYKPWTRIFVIIVSALNCLNIPIGTGIGIYSIWTLMQPEVLAIFEK